MDLFPLLLTYVFVLLLFLRCGYDRREAVLAALIIEGTFVVILTELLSAVHRLEVTALTIGWWACSLLVAILLFIIPKNKSHVDTDSPIPLTAKIFMAATGVIFILSAFVAIASVPNTWDALSYHLPRVEHWIQNKTIAYYPTHISRQDSSPPWAEWGLLHLRLLSGGDYWAGSLQCLSMIFSTLGISLIARWLGAKATGQALAALLSAGLPMGILQSTSTQNDYVLTMWMVLFVYFLLNSTRDGGNLSILLASLSLGLAFLTKGYAYLYALPFLIWWFWASTKRSWLSRSGIFLFIVGMALLLNAAYFYRNWQAFGRLLWAEVDFFNGTFSLNICLANILRNTAMHLCTIYVPWNDWINQHLQDIALFLHIDLNPSQGTMGNSNFGLISLMFNENYAPNLLASFLFVLIFFTAIIKIFQKQRGLQWAYAWTVGAGFVLFCLFLRFQPVNIRFQLTLFVLGSAWVAFLMEKFFNKKWLWCVGSLVMLAAIPWFLFNSSKSLFEVLNGLHHKRIEGYFLKDPSWAMPMMGIASRLSALDCGNIGLINGEDSKEYLLWVTLREFKLPVTRIEAVDVMNATRNSSYPLGKFNPCALVLISAERPSMILLPTGIYGQLWTSKDQQGNTQTALYLPVNLTNTNN